MTLIDHRVLVSAPPEVVWELLSDLTSQSKWHTNTTQCSILTTHHTGEDVRYRLHTERGPDLVCQILSWYNNLGYEYVVIDGPFGKNRGRVRLQAIPEGTVIQWTFEYEYRGFGGILRDRTGVKRRLNKEIADSLKQLRRLVESAGIPMDPTTSERVAMQPAPSAQERASLSANIARTLPSQPVIVQDTPVETPSPTIPDTTPATTPNMHPVTREVSPPTPEHTPQVIIEPPLTDEDTRPNPTVQQSEPKEVETTGKIAAEPAEIQLSADYEEPPTEPKKPSRLQAAIDKHQSKTPEPAPTPGDITMSEALAKEPTPVELPPVVGLTTEHEAPPTPSPDTTPPPLPVITAGEPDQVIPDTPMQQEPASSSPEPESITSPPTITASDDDSTPTKAEPQFTDTIGAVLSGEQSTTPIEASSPAPSLLEQDLNPLGPSIWDVFGIDAPSAEESAADPAPTNATPPPAQFDDTQHPVEVSVPAATDDKPENIEMTPTAPPAQQGKQGVLARSNSWTMGLRRQLSQQQAHVRASRPPNT